MAERDLPKVETGVRFSSPAPEFEKKSDRCYASYKMSKEVLKTEELSSSHERETDFAKKYRHGIQAYKDALLAYKEWLQEKELKELDGTMDSEKMASESISRNMFLDGMAAALDLSQEDEIRIMNEIGFSKSMDVKKQ